MMHSKASREVKGGWREAADSRMVRSYAAASCGLRSAAVADGPCEAKTAFFSKSLGMLKGWLGCSLSPF